MTLRKIKKKLEDQHYAVVGKGMHSAVQICRWTKHSLIDEGECYKEKFYGIKSHLCCQMSPCIACFNECIHCWRPIELNRGITIKEFDDPKQIIESCISAQKKLISGFGGNKKINVRKFKEAQEPMQFAISLIGEPTIYPNLAELILELRKRGKTSFLVTNGLLPNKLLELEKKKALPTQLYISLNTPNEKMYNMWHKSRIKDAWKRFNESLEIMKRLKDKTRTVIRMTLVKKINDKDKYVKEYAKLIKKANPNFIEVKGYMAVGFARKRLGYDTMPNHDDIKAFAKKLAKELKLKLLDEKEFSRVVVLGKDKRKLKIKKKEI